MDLDIGLTIDFSPQDYEKTRLSNIERLKRKQEEDLAYHNKKKTPAKNYVPGQLVYVKNNKRLGTKLSSRFKKEIVKENRDTTIVTNSGRVIHKSHIRN